MAILCFLLDLRSLTPLLLKDVTESLLQLANLYAISPSSSRSEPDCLKDRIALCYVSKNGASAPDETLLEIAYSPRETFSLRDFHLAVEKLPTDSFVPEVNDSTRRCCDLKLSAVFIDQVLQLWGGKDVMKKVIVISASATYDLDSQVQKTLMEAANMYISVEFVMFEKKSSHLNGIEENADELMRCISNIDSFSLQYYLPDIKVFQSLIRRWLQDLQDDKQEPLLASFCFKSNLICSLNQITCNLYMPVNQIVDGFPPCQTCRCHGIPIPLEDCRRKEMKEPSCAITGQRLETCNVLENSIKVGKRTILFLPSYRCLTELQQSSPIKFDIIERTNLGTLSESVIMGASYVVVPLSFSEIEPAPAGTDLLELNALAFQGLCDALHSLDQGLVCFSNWNTENMKEATFPSYYILQPSSKGSMLLRRLAGSEDLLYVPDIKTPSTASVNEEIRSSIQASLEKVELKDYNPLMHERGLHKRLNFLVKESLEFGLPTYKAKDAMFDNDSCGPDSFKGTVISIETVPDDTEDGVAETWEQLVVHEFEEKCSSVHVSKAKVDGLSPPLSHDAKQLAEKTSRILERLEVPPRQRTKVKSPNTLTNDLADTNILTKPPIPFVPVYASDTGLTATQLIKPNFSKLKRKRT